MLLSLAGDVETGLGASLDAVFGESLVSFPNINENFGLAARAPTPTAGSFTPTFNFGPGR